ncbi:Uncharacterised protein g6783 [Pycnogonum litorale]
MDFIRYSSNKVWSILGMESEAARVNPDDKYVLITGCDTGLGHHSASALDKMGFNVIACCLNPDKDGAVELKRESSSKLIVIGMDVTSDQSVVTSLKIVEDIVKDKGLHALVNNAGVVVYGEFEFQTVSHCKSVIDVNMIGTIRVTKYFLPLITRKTGRIINLTSILAYNCARGLSVYGATKAGLENFSNSIRLELYDKGIKVCTIAPGLMTGATNLMCNFEKDVDEMWSAMTPAQQRENERKFDELKRKASHSAASPYNQPTFEWTIRDMRNAVSDVNPVDVSIPCSIIMRTLLFLIRVLPTYLALKLSSIQLKFR